MSRTLKIYQIEQLDYPPACAFQMEQVNALHASGDDGGILILLEHPPVITVGRSGSDGNIIVPKDLLAAQGLTVHETSRGGDVTYHGPGQIVGYPILPLKFHGKDIHRYLRNLERVLMRTLEAYGIPSFRRDGLTGVWTERGKIVSIGVAVRHWITYHGFAFNVAPNMDHFRLINPCGLVGVRMTGMVDFLETTPMRAEVEDRIVSLFCEEFGFDRTERIKDPFVCGSNA